MKVPEGTLSRAQDLLRLAVAKVVRRIHENVMNQALQFMFPEREYKDNFLTGPDETWWRLDT